MYLFLKRNIPSVLFWHFTDQFYHTDNDRIDKVSQKTLKNVGIASLVSAYTLLNANSTTAKSILQNIEKAALSRLQEEKKQSEVALKKGDSLSTQLSIISAWKDWYINSTKTTLDVVKDSAKHQDYIKETSKKIDSASSKIIEELKIIRKN